MKIDWLLTTRVCRWENWHQNISTLIRGSTTFLFHLQVKCISTGIERGKLNTSWHHYYKSTQITWHVQFCSKLNFDSPPLTIFFLQWILDWGSFSFSVHLMLLVHCTVYCSYLEHPWPWSEEARWQGSEPLICSAASAWGRRPAASDPSRPAPPRPRSPSRPPSSVSLTRVAESSLAQVDQSKEKCEG